MMIIDAIDVAATGTVRTMSREARTTRTPSRTTSVPSGMRQGSSPRQVGW